MRRASYTMIEDDLFYSVLNVSRSASTADIQRAYKTLSRSFHPDKQRSNQETAESSFIAIKSAHDVLTDRVLRIAYDYGGVKAVTLVKRSQQQASAARAKSEADLEDLYQLMDDVDVEQAIFLLQEALEENQLHQEQNGQGTDGPPSWSLDAGLESPFAFDSELGRERYSLHFSSRRQSSAYTVTLGANARLNATATGELAASIGCDYQPHAGTHYMVDTRLPLTPAKRKRQEKEESSSLVNVLEHLPQLSLRTSRQLASGSVVVVALNGQPSMLQTWNYTILSYRTILYREQKLQAVYRMGLQPTGRMTFLSASVKTVAFPLHKCRLSIGPYPFKITYQTAESNTPVVSYSIGWMGMWSRLKVTWIAEVFHRWTVQYGIKYDGHALVTGSSAAWTLLLHVHGAEWSIRLPIMLLPLSSTLGYTTPATPVAWMVSLLVGQWLDRQFSDRYKKPLRSDEASSRSSLFSLRDHPELVEKIAGKKRSLETAENGLVILGAKDQSGKDWANLLQFWVVDGQLQVALEAEGMDEAEADTASSWSRWWPSSSPSAAATKKVSDNELTVRYQYKGTVYETIVDRRNIQLPSPQASELGPASRVQ